MPSLVIETNHRREEERIEEDDYFILSEAYRCWVHFIKNVIYSGSDSFWWIIGIAPFLLEKLQNGHPLHVYFGLIWHWMDSRWLFNVLVGQKSQ